MSDLTQLYQAVILDHNKHPRNYGELDEYTDKVFGKNPLCGDEITVYSIINDGLISDISFEAQGCAISRASASLMVEALKGKTREESLALFESFKQLLSAEGKDGVLSPELENLVALTGVKKYPARIKCAFLPWETFFNQ